MRFLRAELRKQSTLAGIWVMVVVNPLLAVTLMGITRVSNRQKPTVDDLSFVVHVCLGTAIGLGVAAAIQDYRGGQWDTFRLALPQRPRLVTVRIIGWIAMAMASALLTLCALALTMPCNYLHPRNALPIATLLISTTLAAAMVTDATRSALVGTSVMLSIVWVAPVALQGIPGARHALASESIAQWETGAWPTHPLPILLGMALLLLLNTYTFHRT